MAGWPGAAGRPGAAHTDCSGSEPQKSVCPARPQGSHPQSLTAVGFLLELKPETADELSQVA